MTNQQAQYIKQLNAGWHTQTCSWCNGLPVGIHTTSGKYVCVTHFIQFELEHEIKRIHEDNFDRAMGVLGK